MNHVIKLDGIMYHKNAVLTLVGSQWLDTTL